MTDSLSTESDDYLPQSISTAVLGDGETDNFTTDESPDAEEFEWTGRFDELELPDLTGLQKVDGEYHCYENPCDKNYSSHQLSKLR
jgi:hypothetical protein